MELALVLSLILAAFGIMLIFLSYQGWYINWVKERIPMEINRLVQGERISGFALLTIGLLQTMKVLVQH